MYLLYRMLTYPNGQGLLGCGLCGEENAHVTAFQLGILIHAGDLGTLGGKIEQELLADVGVSHFTAAEANSDLNAVALSQELLGIAQLGVEIADVDTGGHTDFLDFDNMLVLFRFFLALGLLELELTVVHELANGRDSVGRDLDQVQTGLIGAVLSLGSRHDAELLTGVADQSNFAVADLFIDLMTCGGYTEAPPT